MTQFPPFDNLPSELLDEVVEVVEIAYFKAGTMILEQGQPIHALPYIRSGAVEVYHSSGDLYNRLEEGDIFGQFGLLRQRRVRFPVKAIEDTLLYRIPEAYFQRLCEDDSFADFVELSGSRLKSTVDQSLQENDLMTTRVRKLINRLPVMVETTVLIQDVARVMTENGVSSVLLIEPAEEENSDGVFRDDEGRLWLLAGMITDEDLRVQVVAGGASPDLPVSHLSYHRLITIQFDESVNEAMLTMLRNHIQRLPVLHRRRPVGVVHLSDIVRYETNSSLYLVSNIFSRSSVRDLSRLVPEIRAAFVRLVNAGSTSQMIGDAMSSIGRSLMRRLIELAEDELGPPPVPYCYMVHGSLARHAQSVITDQDNAIVLHDSFDPEQHDEYFKTLAQKVSDGLDACGYDYCKGGIMATNDEWRQPLSQWKRYFEEWIAEPDPQRLLHSCIFFDLDAVHGEERFVEILQDLVATKASKSPRFLGAMARNALNRTPPLGFFRTFVMETDGRQHKIINIKSRGVAPMTDVIRVHALAAGSRAQNSVERLRDIDQAKILPAGQVDKLSYALEFIALVRMRHQAGELQNDQPVDNAIEPENIDSTERHNLKEAFQVLSNAQNFLGFRYPGSEK
ncbi:DUF294 nucleotidyltransferase-like domain-containing protein, partial [Pseudomaricurvus sp.]|uniref:DUF294 nucleotidyltransferase-like domain-containing protein n=1 Tax=Pseudomaricurvus sp. TaxID=2004510 RepID=UPI003F6C0751